MPTTRNQARRDQDGNPAGGKAGSRLARFRFALLHLPKGIAGAVFWLTWRLVWSGC
jgi:hypothetical protein